MYQQTKMLYSGFPMDSYGCSKQDFLKVVSKYTQHIFHLRIPDPLSPQLSKDPSLDEPEDAAAQERKADQEESPDEGQDDWMSVVG